MGRGSGDGDGEWVVAILGDFRWFSTWGISCFVFFIFETPHEHL
jgi:hypothetical protein